MSVILNHILNNDLSFFLLCPALLHLPTSRPSIHLEIFKSPSDFSMGPFWAEITPAGGSDSTALQNQHWTQSLGSSKSPPPLETPQFLGECQNITAHCCPCQHPPWRRGCAVRASLLLRLRFFSWQPLSLPRNSLLPLVGERDAHTSQGRQSSETQVSPWGGSSLRCLIRKLALWLLGAPGASYPLPGAHPSASRSFHTPFLLPLVNLSIVSPCCTAQTRRIWSL